MLGALQCDKPHCTVAEELLHTYSRAFVNRYGFSLSAVDKGRYRPGKGLRVAQEKRPASDEGAGQVTANNTLCSPH